MSQWDVASLLSCSFSGTLHKDDKCQEDVFSDGSSDFAIKGSPHILFSLFSLDLFCPLESIVLKKDCSQEIILRAEGGQLPLITVADLPQMINSNRTRWRGIIERIVAIPMKLYLRSSFYLLVWFVNSQIAGFSHPLRHPVPATIANSVVHYSNPMLVIRVEDPLVWVVAPKAATCYYRWLLLLTTLLYRHD